MLDARGKIVRVGDYVHKVAARRTVRKKTPNGRALPPLKAWRVRAVDTEYDLIRIGHRVLKSSAFVKE